MNEKPVNKFPRSGKWVDVFIIVFVERIKRSFYRGIHTLSERWQKVIDFNGTRFD